MSCECSLNVSDTSSLDSSGFLSAMRSLISASAKAFYSINITSSSLRAGMVKQTTTRGLFHDFLSVFCASIVMHSGPPALSAQLAAMVLGMTTTVRRPQCQLVFWGNRFSTTASPSVQLVMLVLDMTASIMILVRLVRIMLFFMLCLPWTVFRPSDNITSVIHFNIMILVTTLSLVFWFMAVMCHPAYLINLALLGVFSRQMKPQAPTQFLRRCFLVMSGLVNFACAKCPVMSIVFIEVACSPSRCCRS